MSRYDELLSKLTQDWIDFIYDLSDWCDLYDITNPDLEYGGWTNEVFEASLYLPKEKSASCSYDEEGHLEYSGIFKKCVDELVKKWSSYPELRDVHFDENELKDGLVYISGKVNDLSQTECVETYTPIQDKDIPVQPKLPGLENVYEDYFLEYRVKYDNNISTFTDYKEAYKFFDTQKHNNLINECALTIGAVDHLEQDLLTWKLYENKKLDDNHIVEDIDPEYVEDEITYSVNYTDIPKRKVVNSHEELFDNLSEAKECAYKLKAERNCHSLEINKLVNGRFVETLKCWELQKTGLWEEFDPQTNKPLREMNNDELLQAQQSTKFGTTKYDELECVSLINSFLAYEYAKELNGGDRSTIVSKILDDKSNYNYNRYLKKYTDELGEDKVRELIQGQVDDVDKVIVGTDYNSIKWVTSRSKHNSAFKKITFPKDQDKSVKDWYMKEYPTDELGEEIPETTTFETIFNVLQRGKGEDVYDYIADDSIVRERVFDELSNILDCEYDDIFYAWLGESLGNAPKDQVAKMDAWHNGERKENIKACSVDKLKTFLQICKDKGYQKEVDEIEQELRNRETDESLTEGEQSSTTDEIIIAETDGGNTLVLPDFEINILDLFSGHDGFTNKFNNWQDIDFDTIDYDPDYEEITIKGVYHYKGKDLHFNWTIDVDGLGFGDTAYKGIYFADYFEYLCEEPYETESGEEVDLGGYNYVWVPDGDERASNSKLGTDEDDGNFYYTNDDLKAYYEYEPIECYIGFAPNSKYIKTWNDFAVWCDDPYDFERSNVQDEIEKYFDDIDNTNESLQYDGKYEYTKDEDETKKEALSKYLGCSKDDLERETYGDKYGDILIVNNYSVTNGEHKGEEYLVLKGTDERNQATYNEIEEIIDDCGGIEETFSSNFTKDILDYQYNYLDWDGIYDIAYEDCKGWEGDITDNSFIDSLTKDNLTKDELREKVLDYWIEGWGSNKDFLHYCYENNHVNLDEIVKTCIADDGYGHFLSSWDGEEIELGNDFYAYRN